MKEAYKNIAVLIVAAGKGERMGNPLPKQYTRIHGKTLLAYCIEAFQNAGLAHLIQCVIDPDHIHYFNDATAGYSILPPVNGGRTRQESVYNGLKSLVGHDPKMVLVHDAARPCVTAEDIHNIIHTLSTYEAASLASPVTETLRYAHNSIADKVIPRENSWMMQTPQAFHYHTLLSLHETAEKNNFVGTDDTSLASEYDIDVAIVASGRHNIKVTTQDDLIMAETLLSSRMETRIGSGFDVHAFSDQPASHIRLCGVNLDHNRSLAGHSDADVGLHALTDAILGALADGDIGSHFPPSDPQWKGRDSHVFLDKSVDILKSRGGQLRHIDLTIICEKPKVGPHRERIRNHLAEYLNLSTDRVSVKATTTEKIRVHRP